MTVPENPRGVVMSDVVVIPLSSGEFVLQILSRNRSVEHSVDIPQRVLDQLGVPRERAKDVVSTSVEWLREHTEELPPRVDLGARWDADEGFRHHLTAAVT
jgi:hypothetical protein